MTELGRPQVNIPEVVAEVAAAFGCYEAALVGNDVATLDELFWNAPHTVRYGVTENLYGYDAIKAFRGARSPAGLTRSLQHTVIPPSAAISRLPAPNSGALEAKGSAAKPKAGCAFPKAGAWSPPTSAC